ncbi:hypothetical protein Gotri_005324 [Gossypium trilobum]|uniref:Glycosyl transferase family 51 domain-containing protein n=1 Tax=Gossypium trilobum TaxID=34281 RepID=A0A7J9EW53_9ROSI|nr:hypothetical protein [Gossypium trilobum]
MSDNSLQFTWQLVKNTFLKNERTLWRKILEMVLALALERTMSKQRILSSYVCKIYWGHGINGIESASNFYFGKHPSQLSLAESAMLAGLIPAPEHRSPLRDRSSGKTFQARVLKRMVKSGFLDIKMALLTVRQPLYVRLRRPEHADELSDASSFSELFQDDSTDPKKSPGCYFVVPELSLAYIHRDNIHNHYKHEATTIYS